MTDAAYQFIKDVVGHNLSESVTTPWFVVKCCLLCFSFLNLS